MTPDQVFEIEKTAALAKEALDASRVIEEDNFKLRLVLLEAKLAIEYLHRLYAPTGSTNTALAKIEQALSE